MELDRRGKQARNSTRFNLRHADRPVRLAEEERHKDEIPATTATTAGTSPATVASTAGTGTNQECGLQNANCVQRRTASYTVCNGGASGAYRQEHCRLFYSSNGSNYGTTTSATNATTTTATATAA